MAQPLERRRRPRSGAPLPQGFQITVDERGGQPRTLAAKLLDFNEAGVGVEMFVPVRAGSPVSVEGRLKSSELELLVSGSARVIHSRRLRDGNYRVGLSLDDVAYRKSA